LAEALEGPLTAERGRPQAEDRDPESGGSEQSAFHGALPDGRSVWTSGFHAERRGGPQSYAEGKKRKKRRSKKTADLSPERSLPFLRNRAVLCVKLPVSCPGALDCASGRAGPASDRGPTGPGSGLRRAAARARRAGSPGCGCGG